MIAAGLVALLAVQFASLEEPKRRGPLTDDTGIAGDTVHVAAPTGDTDTDRASILAAIHAVGPGGVVQFAAGTYIVGRLIRVPVSGITLLGHPDGTTLRGCAPEGFVDQDIALFACNGLELTGGHQTVRNLTFEYAWHGLFIGCCSPADMAALQSGEGLRLDQPGGHIIEGNTFRNSSNGLRVVGQSADPIVIRENEFRNTMHALVVNGGTAHVLDNDVLVTESERVPMGHPGGAIIVVPLAPVRKCGRNIVAGNRVDGHTDGIAVTLLVSGINCRGTIIRANTIVTRDLRFSTAIEGVRITSPTDSSLTGIAIALSNIASDSVPGPGFTLHGEGEAALDSTVIEGNRIIGGSGLGIEVLRSSGNRITNNTITGITRRDPFPGNTVNSTDPERSGWEASNGSGIWISPGSEHNEIAGNSFDDIAASAVVLEGDSNRVVLSEGDAVRDLGTGNDVIIRTGDTERATPHAEPAGLAASQQSALADTIRSLAIESMTLWNRLDPDAWLALFADSVRWYYHATSLDRAGVENMVRGLMSFIRDSRYRVVSEPDVVILGPDAATASFAMVQSATGINGVELEEATGLIFVYQRREGDWKIVRVHESIEPPPDSVITETIMARTRELAASWERLDADAYLAHFSEDLTFYFQGSRVSRTAFEAVVREAITSLRESTFDVVNPEVEVLGPNAAAISFELRELMLDDSGTTTELNGVMTLVYERRDGQWLVVRAHESLR